MYTPTRLAAQQGKKPHPDTAIHSGEAARASSSTKDQQSHPHSLGLQWPGEPAAAAIMQAPLWHPALPLPAVLLA